jgi:hypothetical protein
MNQRIEESFQSTLFCERRLQFLLSFKHFDMRAKSGGIERNVARRDKWHQESQDEMKAVAWGHKSGTGQKKNIIFPTHIRREETKKTIERVGQ